ncbi:hypothetical protein ACG7TL_001146 [Trametes sanguinea]
MAGIIPRNAAEWAHAFANARSTDRIVVLGHPPRGSFCVKLGDCVTVKPDGSRRDDVHIQEEEWVAQVRALATSAFLGPLVKLRWFIRSRDLWLRQCSDTFTADYFNLAGENELFPIRHETITIGDAIHDIIAVEHFDPTTVSLRAFHDTTLYYRNDHYFERVNNSDFYRLPRDTVTLLCTGILKSTYNTAWNYFSAKELGDEILGYWRSWYERADRGENTAYTNVEWPRPSLDWGSIDDVDASVLTSVPDTVGDWVAIPDVRKIGMLNRRVIISRKRGRNMFDLTNLWKKLVIENLGEKVEYDSAAINPVADKPDTTTGGDVTNGTYSGYITAHRENIHQRSPSPDKPLF